MEWKNININIQNIETDTGKATLIKMPNNSDYAGYSFWHPSKLIRRGKHSYAKSLGYTDEFTFQLKKYGNGKYNKFDVIKEIEISVKEFEETFGVMDENIIEPNNFEIIHHIPEEKEVKEVEVDDELKY